ncbi:MAG: TetR/AcrR family transcriptional regulator [Chitinispirillaceae bacterium]|nr:TetR/AcrR family transcriptional regulator [Chitinispirillaceae bacterium]
MTKIVKEYEERKRELLETAQKLFFTKGYEKTSVNDIITAVGIAKGTFYHYFKTKEELLDKLIRQMADSINSGLKEIVASPRLNAIEKLNRFFSFAGNFKLQNKETFIVSAIMMHRPENILFRKKLETIYLQVSSELLTALIRQGVEEKLFDTPFPDIVPHMLLAMGIHLREEFASLLLNEQRTDNDIDFFCRGYEMYQNSIERILGAPQGSISFITDHLIRSFFN